MSGSQFAERVCSIVAKIPVGKVMTYGQIAALCGNPRAARIVGGIAHFGPIDLPWQRVVNKSGGLAAGYPGGREGHKKDLENEGIEVHGNSVDYHVDVAKLIWQPNSEIRDQRSKIEGVLLRSRIPNINTIYIVGPTASGKTQLAIELAKKLGAEIVCADSQTIRRYMNIGTAKPTIKEMQGIKHHMLDIIDPFEDFSLAKFTKHTKNIIDDIHKRNIIAIVVGGTGLYIDSLFFEFDLPKLKSKGESLEKYTVTELQELIKSRNLKLPTNINNPRHLINVIKRDGAEGSKQEPSPHSIIIGINLSKEVLVERINKRADLMFDNGLVEEVKSIRKRFSSNNKRFDAIGYQIVERYLEAEINEQEARELFKIAHRQYAKRQISWFKRNKYIKWFSSPEQASDYIIEKS